MLANFRFYASRNLTAGFRRIFLRFLFCACKFFQLRHVFGTPDSLLFSKHGWYHLILLITHVFIIDNRTLKYNFHQLLYQTINIKGYQKQGSAIPLARLFKVTRLLTSGRSHYNSHYVSAEKDMTSQCEHYSDIFSQVVGIIRCSCAFVCISVVFPFCEPRMASRIKALRGKPQSVFTLWRYRDLVEKCNGAT